MAGKTGRREYLSPHSKLGACHDPYPRHPIQSDGPARRDHAFDDGAACRTSRRAHRLAIDRTRSAVSVSVGAAVVSRCFSRVDLSRSAGDQAARVRCRCALRSDRARLSGLVPGAIAADHSVPSFGSCAGVVRQACDHRDRMPQHVDHGASHDERAVARSGRAPHRQRGADRPGADVVDVHHHPMVAADRQQGPAARVPSRGRRESWGHHASRAFRPRARRCAAGDHAGRIGAVSARAGGGAGQSLYADRRAHRRAQFSHLGAAGACRRTAGRLAAQTHPDRLCAVPDHRDLHDSAHHHDRCRHCSALQPPAWRGSCRTRGAIRVVRGAAARL